VIEGISSGRKAAIGIDKFLGGGGMIDEVLVPVENAGGYNRQERRLRGEAEMCYRACCDE